MSKAIDKGGKKDEAVGDRGQHDTETSHTYRWVSP